ncbi:hypothetical protein IWQ60_001061 [Tieghemiomyces parasiticus]|uniref:NmrA-like domain-containing protein n=1 Tax=Tieghemiomyces parasiticus TaxID=78921 RepID=A0A9W8AHQ7_9FUNG|nr:hypothetical protein IWQ60_001061 [Tieghemiomyces parasiticus]
MSHAVVDALLDSRRFAVRALSRNVKSSAANALAARGVEVVQADVYNAGDLERAFAGADGVFFTTLFELAPRLPKNELVQGQNVANAAKRAGVKHVIFSTLPSIREISDGKYIHATQFDEKAEVTEYIRSLDLPTTFFVYGYFMTNVTRNPNVYRVVGPDAYELIVTVPVHTKVPVTDATGDAGRAVAKAFLNPADTIGREYLLSSEYKTIAQLAAEVGRHTGKKIRAVQLTPEETSRHVFLRLRPSQDMFNSIHEFGYAPHLTLEPTVQAFGKQGSFADFLAREKKVAFPE